MHFENEFRKKIDNIELVLKPELLSYVKQRFTELKFLYKNDDMKKLDAEYKKAWFPRELIEEGSKTDDRES